jgi:hypothetical protein
MSGKQSSENEIGRYGDLRLPGGWCFAHTVAILVRQFSGGVNRHDPFAAIPDVKVLLATGLKNLSATTPDVWSSCLPPRPCTCADFLHRHSCLPTPPPPFFFSFFLCAACIGGNHMPAMFEATGPQQDHLLDGHTLPVSSWRLLASASLGRSSTSRHTSKLQGWLCSMKMLCEHAKESLARAG